ncbi:hypothetical protein Anapl_00011 [Anas platyrhynchos]|uniref:Uncharacterized protein n=1 Tax=Anas platyrhynchos TaxID=8839 RepID=R0LPY5_ANAPL|nr:hypothetical protein Anapl_00011 [Anas platyrhynchos]
MSLSVGLEGDKSQQMDLPGDRNWREHRGFSRGPCRTVTHSLAGARKLDGGKPQARESLVRTSQTRPEARSRAALHDEAKSVPGTAPLRPPPYVCVIIPLRPLREAPAVRGAGLACQPGGPDARTAPDAGHILSAARPRGVTRGPACTCATLSRPAINSRRQRSDAVRLTAPFPSAKAYPTGTKTRSDSFSSPIASCGSPTSNSMGTGHFLADHRAAGRKDHLYRRAPPGEPARRWPRGLHVAEPSGAACGALEQEHHRGSLHDTTVRELRREAEAVWQPQEHKLKHLLVLRLSVVTTATFYSTSHTSRIPAVQKPVSALAEVNGRVVRGLDSPRVTLKADTVWLSLSAGRRFPPSVFYLMSSFWHASAAQQNELLHPYGTEQPAPRPGLFCPQSRVTLVAWHQAVLLGATIPTQHSPSAVISTSNVGSASSGIAAPLHYMWQACQRALETEPFGRVSWKA